MLTKINTDNTNALIDRIGACDPVAVSGRVSQVIGMMVEVIGLEAGLGELCRISLPRGGGDVLSEVIGFTSDRVLLMPYQRIEGLQPGLEVKPTGVSPQVPVGNPLLGRVLDGLGRPIDGKGPIDTRVFRSTTRVSPPPLTRAPIRERMVTGVRAIDGCIPCGRGQRMGIFSGSGVGKSTLLGMICQNAESDVNVIALIGERGREVREFIENSLGPAGLARSVVVAVTSDESPLLRIQGAQTAMTIAEFFRERGRDVVLVMDSVTRYAMALREVTLSTGEMPTSRGYTPSVFARLPVLLERAGTGECGSITAFISVLVEGDDIEADPVGDTVRSILDGHIVLSRDLANNGVFPAIDLLQSISRLGPQVSDAQSLQDSARVLDLLALYTQSEDLINIGAYVAGSNPRLDDAIAKIHDIRAFVSQNAGQNLSYADTQTALSAIADG